jgi:hypothetical protein
MRAQFDKVADAARRLVATRRLPVWLGLLLVTLSAGCGLMRTVMKVPGQTVRAVTPGNQSQPAVDPVEVQETLLRFADAYSTGMTLGADKLRRGTNAPDPVEILKWKIAFSTQICSIASGPNEFANLLDMISFVTATRLTLEGYWQPKIFGDSALPMLEGCRNAEKDIWRFAGTVLKPGQLAELHQAIEAWRQRNPLPEDVLAMRAVGFASQLGKADKSGASAVDSVFNLLDVDPLAGLDPAVREIAQTRLFAERALYVTQQMPTLLRWQIQLLSLNAVQMPAVQQLVTNTTQIAASVDRVSRVAEQLPNQISTEREEILKSLQSQETNVSSLMTSGTQMSDSLNTTLTTFTALMKLFGVGDTNSAGPPDTNSQPFRIQDYTQTAAQLEATSRQLTELLVTLNRTIDSTNLAKLSEQIAPAVQKAQTGGKEIVDYAFWKGVLLVVVVLVAALIYRFLAARMTATGPK